MRIYQIFFWHLNDATSQTEKGRLAFFYQCASMLHLFHILLPFLSERQIF